MVDLEESDVTNTAAFANTTQNLNYSDANIVIIPSTSSEICLVSFDMLNIGTC